MADHNHNKYIDWESDLISDEAKLQMAKELRLLEELRAIKYVDGRWVRGENWDEVEASGLLGDGDDGDGNNGTPREGRTPNPQQG
jgi:hypothetical protein